MNYRRILMWRINNNPIKENLVMIVNIKPMISTNPRSGIIISKHCPLKLDFMY